MPKRFFLDIKHWEINNSQSSLHKTGRKADNAGIYGHFIFSRFMLAFLVKKDLKKHHTAASSFCKLNNLSNFFESLKTLSLTLAVFILFAQFPAESHASGSGILKAIEKELVELADKVRPLVVSLSPYVPPSPSIRLQSQEGENHRP